ncbi:MULTISPECIES: hypothetical protein [Natrialbaceae]|uniref:hypothetical protein n=1 Tax=Natrialbaceae TaxID=1644061 RepID=UPI00207CE702|nr:hypothetical protein [Natronococcus sp. CG52]
MSQDVPVKTTDLLVLVVVSLLGGLVLATWTLSPRLAPDFAVSILAGTVTLAFFLFIPVMGVRLFLDERNENR